MMMRSEKTGIISDVHSNRLALEAVLEALEKEGVKRILNLGDSLFGPMEPEATFQLLSKYDITSIAGNQDRIIVEGQQVAGKNPTLQFVSDDLSDAAMDWLRTLAVTHIVGEIYMCHGQFEVDDVPLMEAFADGQVVVKSQEVLETLTEVVDQNIILCGHTHVPRCLHLDHSGKYIVNPGSVGLQAYDDDLPFYHKMESYSPLAKYAILELDEHGVHAIHQKQVRYDYKEAARQAMRNGRPDWAAWIKSGLAYS